MPLDALRREHTLSDADLCAFTFGLISNMTRDAVQFATRGVTAGDITALEALADAFELFPNDDYYRADITLAVDAKEATRSAMTVEIRDIIQCAVIKWGEGSAQYKKFSAQKMTSESDRLFLTTARQVVLVATEYLADLASVGLTQTMIDDLSDNADIFHNNLIAILDAQTNRDSKTQERIQDSNEIYYFVTKYCQIGKIIWDDVDEAKYNDYIIYPKENSQLSKPQNLTAVYDPLDPPNVTLSWDAVINATNYDVFYNIANPGAPAGEYQLLNNYAASPVEIPSVIAKRNYYKIKAKNDESTSSYSDEAYVDVPV